MRCFTVAILVREPVNVPVLGPLTRLLGDFQSGTNGSVVGIAEHTRLPALARVLICGPAAGSGLKQVLEAAVVAHQLNQRRATDALAQLHIDVRLRSLRHVIQHATEIVF